MIASNSTALAEILPSIKSLPRADKFRLLQLLTVDVAGEEGISLSAVEQSVAVWSQFDAFEGAAALTRFLEEQQAKP